MNPALLAVLSGIAFSIWPILSNRSGMPGSPVTFCILLIATFTSTLPALKQGIRIESNSSLWTVIATGVVLGLGMFLFNGALSKIDGSRVAAMVVLMVVSQIATPAIWQLLNGNLNLRLAGGIAAALLAAFLLVGK